MSYNIDRIRLESELKLADYVLEEKMVTESDFKRDLIGSQHQHLFESRQANPNEHSGVKISHFKGIWNDFENFPNIHDVHDALRPDQKNIREPSKDAFIRRLVAHFVEHNPSEAARFRGKSISERNQKRNEYFKRKTADVGDDLSPEESIDPGERGRKSRTGNVERISELVPGEMYNDISRIPKRRWGSWWKRWARKSTEVPNPKQSVLSLKKWTRHFIMGYQIERNLLYEVWYNSINSTFSVHDRYGNIIQRGNDLPTVKDALTTLFQFVAVQAPQTDEFFKSNVSPEVRRINQDLEREGVATTRTAREEADRLRKNKDERLARMMGISIDEVPEKSDNPDSWGGKKRRSAPGNETGQHHSGRTETEEEMDDFANQEAEEERARKEEEQEQIRKNNQKQQEERKKANNDQIKMFQQAEKEKENSAKSHAQKTKSEESEKADPASQQGQNTTPTSNVGGEEMPRTDSSAKAQQEEDSFIYYSGRRYKNADSIRKLAVKVANDKVKENMINFEEATDDMVSLYQKAKENQLKQNQKEKEKQNDKKASQEANDSGVEDHEEDEGPNLDQYAADNEEADFEIRYGSIRAKTENSIARLAKRVVKGEIEENRIDFTDADPDQEAYYNAMKKEYEEEMEKEKKKLSADEGEVDDEDLDSYAGGTEDDSVPPEPESDDDIDDYFASQFDTVDNDDGDGRFESVSDNSMNRSGGMSFDSSDPSENPLYSPEMNNNVDEVRSRAEKSPYTRQAINKSFGEGMIKQYNSTRSRNYRNVLQEIIDWFKLGRGRADKIAVPTSIVTRRQRIKGFFSGAQARSDFVIGFSIMDKVNFEIWYVQEISADGRNQYASFYVYDVTAERIIQGNIPHYRNAIQVVMMKIGQEEDQKKR